MALALMGSTVVTGTVFETDGTTPVVGSEIFAHDSAGNVIGRAVSIVGGAYVLVLQ